MNVNFYNKKFYLYINGALCAKRIIVVLARGQQTNEERHYAQPISAEARDILQSIFGLTYDRTWFKHKPYYYSYFGSYMLEDYKDCKIYEDDIADMTVKIEYEELPQSISMKKLMGYPADLVIDYLKERGITSCPLINS